MPRSWLNSQVPSCVPSGAALPWRPRQVHELQQKMSRFHGLTAANPERKQIAASVREGCDSLKWQVGSAARHRTAARGAAQAGAGAPRRAAPATLGGA
jgi:hypothetical protein